MEPRKDAPEQGACKHERTVGHFERDRGEIVDVTFFACRDCGTDLPWDGKDPHAASEAACVRGYIPDCACPRCRAMPAHETRGWKP